MEYRKKCNVCGRIFCYTDGDIKNNRNANLLSGIASLGAATAAFSGNWGATRANQEISYHEDGKVVDFDHCPNCGSTDLVLLNEEEWKEEVCRQEINKNGGININPNASEDSLIKRVKHFIEDKDWVSAELYTNQILDINPENGYVYYLRLLIGNKCSSSDELCNKRVDIKNDKNYLYIQRYAEDSIKEEVEQCVIKIDNSNKDEIYSAAMSKMNGTNPESYYEAIRLFETIHSWKDSKEQIDKCKRIIEEIKVKQEAITANIRAKEQQKAEKRKKVTAMTFLAMLLMVFFAIIYMNFIKPNQEYKKAISLLESGRYEEAYTLLTEMGKNEEIKSSKYERAMTSMSEGKYIVAYEILEGLDYKDSAEKRIEILSNPDYIKEAPVGSLIALGEFEQDGIIENGKETITWQVLKKQDSKMLLISSKGLSAKPYNTIDTKVTWETCSLRSWLNSEFLNEAFNQSQKLLILSTLVKADKNPDRSTDSGNNTNDEIFLLSVPEANSLFNSDADRIMQITEQAKKEGASKNSEGVKCWWLRTPGLGQENASYVGLKGQVENEYGCNVAISDVVVRPAMWIDLTNLH